MSRSVLLVLFLCPEASGWSKCFHAQIFFHPEIFVDSMTTPLPEVVDHCISQCPIDYRRRLYGNIVLSGGSTAFQYFKDPVFYQIHIDPHDRYNMF